MIVFPIFFHLSHWTVLSLNLSVITNASKFDGADSAGRSRQTSSLHSACQTRPAQEVTQWDNSKNKTTQQNQSVCLYPVCFLHCSCSVWWNPNVVFICICLEICDMFICISLMANVEHFQIFIGHMYFFWNLFNSLAYLLTGWLGFFYFITFTVIRDSHY